MEAIVDKMRILEVLASIGYAYECIIDGIEGDAKQTIAKINNELLRLEDSIHRLKTINRALKDIPLCDLQAIARLYFNVSNILWPIVLDDTDTDWRMDTTVSSVESKIL
jgi:hypothetical protein